MEVLGYELEFDEVACAEELEDELAACEAAERVDEVRHDPREREIRERRLQAIRYVLRRRLPCAAASHSFMRRGAA